MDDKNKLASSVGRLCIVSAIMPLAFFNRSRSQLEKKCMLIWSRYNLYSKETFVKKIVVHVAGGGGTPWCVYSVGGTAD